MLHAFYQAIDSPPSSTQMEAYDEHRELDEVGVAMCRAYVGII